MADLITALGSFFTFIISQMGNIADFFTTSTIGQIILGVGLFALVFNIVVAVINKLKG